VQKSGHLQEQENIGEIANALRNSLVKTGNLVIFVNLAILKVGVSGT